MLVASQVAKGKPSIRHWPDLSDEERRRRHGTGTHTPITALTVDEPTTIVFEFTIGSQSVKAGGRLLVVWRWPFDWSDLQTEAPDGVASQDQDEPVAWLNCEHYPAADSPTARLTAKYNWIAGIEPWHHQIQLTTDRELVEGDVVRVTCGDTSNGGPGWRAPTCAAERCCFLMLIDHDGDACRNRLVPTPTFPLRPGKPTELTAICPSDAVVGEPVKVIVRADDCWGNPTTLATAPTIQWEDGRQPIPTTLDENAVRPVYEAVVTHSRTGTRRFQAIAPDARLTAQSNPLEVQATPPSQRLVWGDLHSGQTEIGCGCGTLAEHYAFGRDCAALSFITHQANDHYVTQAEWEETRTVTAEFYEAGRYVPILGCEWSPLTKDGGDRNVFYGTDMAELKRSDRFFIEEPADPTPDIPQATDFHDAFRDQDVLVNIHVGGRMTNLDWHEPQIERLCELHSTHGTVDWFMWDVLERGYQVGFTAGTDGVMGRPGACNPGRRLIRNLRNGLTAVYCDDVTRESIWEALQQRRCYATTGQRMRVWVDVDGQPMGADHTLAGNEMSINIRVEGTTALERVQLVRGRDLVQNFACAEPHPDNTRFRFLWGGSGRKGTARLQRADWEGAIRIDGGTFTSVEPVNFPSVEDKARISAERLDYRFATAGNCSGVIVGIHGDEQSTLHCQGLVMGEPFQETYSLGDIQNPQRATVAMLGFNRFFSANPAPDPAGPRTFEKRVVLPAEPGAYWVRVTQLDQGVAWSSPVYCQ